MLFVMILYSSLTKHKIELTKEHASAGDSSADAKE